MAPKVISKGKEKGGGRGEGKSDRTKANRATSNKKLFLDLALEEKVKGNRLGKAFNAMGWENITKSFNERWVSGSGYDPYARTFTVDDDRWNEMVKLTYIYFYFVIIHIC